MSFGRLHRKDFIFNTARNLEFINNTVITTQEFYIQFYIPGVGQWKPFLLQLQPKPLNVSTGFYMMFLMSLIMRDFPLSCGKKRQLTGEPCGFMSSHFCPPPICFILIPQTHICFPAVSDFGFVSGCPQVTKQALS